MMVPGTDPMFHRHLVAAYAAVWIIQLGYLAYVGRKWFAERRAGKQGSGIRAQGSEPKD